MLRQNPANHVQSRRCQAVNCIQACFFLGNSCLSWLTKNNEKKNENGWLRKGFPCHGLKLVTTENRLQIPSPIDFYVNCYNPNKANVCHCALGPILRHPKEPITPFSSSRPIMVASMTSSTTWLERWRVSGLGFHSTGVRDQMRGFVGT